MPLPKKGSFHELVAQANANSFFVSDTTAHPVKPRRAKKPKLTLTQRQLELLSSVAKGERKLAQARGAIFVCRRTKVGFGVASLDGSCEERTVLLDFSACSCPDNQMRKRKCKHMEAAKCFSRGS